MSCNIQYHLYIQDRPVSPNIMQYPILLDTVILSLEFCPLRPAQVMGTPRWKALLDSSDTETVVRGHNVQFRCALPLSWSLLCRFLVGFHCNSWLVVAWQLKTTTVKLLGLHERGVFDYLRVSNLLRLKFSFRLELAPWLLHGTCRTSCCYCCDVLWFLRFCPKLLLVPRCTEQVK